MRVLLDFARYAAVLTVTLLLSAIQTLSAQSVFLGLSMEEVPIPSATRAEIEQDAGFDGTARCWRLYACIEPSADVYIAAIFGFQDPEENINAPFFVDCPDCTGENKFYQSPFGDLIGALITPLIYQVFPASRYDSWFTLGEVPYPTAGYQYTSQNNNPEVAFENGGAYLDFSEGGSAVFYLPNETPVVGGRPGPDGRVLLGQFTSDGTVEGNISIQLIFLDAMGAPITPASTVEEYNLAFSSDGSTPINCAGYGVGGCTDPNACNFNSGATISDGSCFYATAIYDCDGNCQNDSNNDGICDPLDSLVSELNCGAGTVWDDTVGQCVSFDECPADFNNDDQIDSADLLTFLSAFGNNCP